MPISHGPNVTCNCTICHEHACYDWREQRRAMSAAAILIEPKPRYHYRYRFGDLNAGHAPRIAPVGLRSRAAGVVPVARSRC